MLQTWQWFRRHLVALIVLVVVIGGLAAAIAIRPAQTESGQTTGEQIWTCSMHPQIRLPKPGRCPICGMNLIPVTQLKPQQEQQSKQAGLATEEVKERRLIKEVRAVGKLDYNESRVEVITARVAGRIDRLYVDFTGVEVKQGDHLVQLYSPNLLVAQQELLLAVDATERIQGANRAAEDRYAQTNLKAAREKLLLLGILPEQIEQIEKTKKPQTHLTIFAPLGGTVIEKQVRVGQYVQEGDPLYRIAELDPVWLYLNIYEYDIGWVEYGQGVEVSLEAFPGEVLRGTVTFVDPFLDDKTRAVKVRVNLKNPGARLKPAMYASAVIRVPLQSNGSPQPTGYAGKYSCPMHPEVVRDEPGKCPVCQMKLEQVPAQKWTVAKTGGNTSPQPPKAGDKVLAIPTSAVLDTGIRQVAYRLRQDGAYELVDLQVGTRATDLDDAQHRPYFPILKGLNAGERVVASGGFMLDSQRQIEGMPSVLYPEGQSAANLHAGHGGMAMPETAPRAPGHKH